MRVVPVRELIVLVLLAGASAARADVVEPPPSSCPAGGVPSTSHAGPHCDPAPACTLSSMCGEGQACETVGLCIERVACGGLRPPDAGPCFEDHVVGTCAAGGTCSTGTCELRNVCVAPSSDRGGCSCRAGRSSAALGLGALGLVLAALVTRRR